MATLCVTTLLSQITYVGPRQQHDHNCRRFQLELLSTYVNLRKWSMAQRTPTQDSYAAKAVNGLLDSAARVSDSPGAPASIGFCALSEVASQRCLPGHPLERVLLIHAGRPPFTLICLLAPAPNTYRPPDPGTRHVRGPHPARGWTAMPMAPPNASSPICSPSPRTLREPTPPDDHLVPRAGRFQMLLRSAVARGALPDSDSSNHRHAIHYPPQRDRH